jgi:hypothetical protein
LHEPWTRNRWFLRQGQRFRDALKEFIDASREVEQPPVLALRLSR